MILDQMSDQSGPSLIPINSSNDTPARLPIENVEIVYLSVIVSVALLLNFIVFVQLLRASRTPTARTSFLAGPYHMTSFTLFKLNLCVTDFIILIHGLGKIVWLLTFEWKFGSYGCKFYMFLSALGFYANSNIIVAIGLDRLKVVYTSHVQGATSMRRVQNLISGSWALAILCSLPQLFFWDTFLVTTNEGNYVQCTSFMSQPMQDLISLWPKLPITYEILHQGAVFWIPFTIIFFSYLLIVIRLLHYTFTPKKIVRTSKSSHSDVSGRAVMSYNPLRVPSSCDHLIVESIAMERIEVSRGPLGSWLSAPLSKKISTASDPGPRIQQTNKRLCARLKGFSTFTRTGSLPVWRRQIRSRIFITALAVVVAHCMMWLPYNLINTLRYIDDKHYESLFDSGAALLEDLIIVNSLINPLLYSYQCR